MDRTRLLHRLERGFKFALLGFALLAATGLTFSILSLFIKGRDAAPGVTAKGIVQVRPGMRAAQVLALLGRPYHLTSYKGSGTHNIEGCPNDREGLIDQEVSDTLNILALLQRATADTAVHWCDRGDFRAHDRNTKFRYTRPVPWAGNYPMLRIDLDATLHVLSVYVSRRTPYLLLDNRWPAYGRYPDSRQNYGDFDTLRQLFDK